jgi:ATP-dependent RNA helicase DDX46/PRP5
LAKLEAWKKKQAEERERKQKELAAIGGTRTLLDEIDKRAASSPAVVSPHSPSIANGDASPPRYTGKFDPKAIARKATVSTTGATTLGRDVPLPEIAKASATSSSSAAGLKADKTPTATSRSSTGTNLFNQIHFCLIGKLANGKVAAPVHASALPKSRGNVSGFGFGNKLPSDVDKSSHKRALDFGDEEATRKKLEKLPTPPTEDVNGDGDAASAGIPDGQDDDDDIDMQDAGTEEETAAAARAAAEKREERLHSQILAQESTETKGGDVVMLTGEEEHDATEPMEQDEDVDPLDAFMSGLGHSASTPKPVNVIKKPNRSNKRQPEALFSDDENDLEAVDANPDDILAMASKARKKKDLPTVNHAKMNYEPFRRNFYVEPAELVGMTEEEVADLRLELDGIKIRVSSLYPHTS